MARDMNHIQPVLVEGEYRPLGADRSTWTPEDIVRYNKLIAYAFENVFDGDEREITDEGIAVVSALANGYFTLPAPGESVGTFLADVASGAIERP